MAQNTKNFKVSEFDCKCGCHSLTIDQRVIDMAQRIRDKLGVPVHVNSGCRCVMHNAKVNGVKGSQHTLGLAADLSCKLGAKKLIDAIKELYKAGNLPELKYCKEYSSWVHIDCGRIRNKIFDLRT